MPSIWKAAVEELDRGRDFILATILAVKGSSPRHVGTRFLVRGDGDIVGTIGGGLFEANVQDFARLALQSKTSHRALFSFTGRDADSHEMICGGEAEVLIEFVASGDRIREDIFRRLLEMTGERTSGFLFTSVSLAAGGTTAEPINHLLLDQQGKRMGGFLQDHDALRAMPQTRSLKPAQILDATGLEHPVFLEWIRSRGTVYIFGAGHVGISVAHLAAYVDFRVIVADDRDEFSNSRRIPDADRTLVLDSFHHAFSGLEIDEDSYVVIVTRGHAHDKSVLTQALGTNAGYIGMIGSRRKTGLIFQALLEEGFTKDDLQRVHAPIGLPIGGETPEEIGVSILAQMIAVRNRKDQIGRAGD